MALRQQLQIGGLPSPKELREMGQQGCLTLVNVSGLQLAQMYPAQVLAGFDLHEFAFSDLFSRSLPGASGATGVAEAAAAQHDEPGAFVAAFTPEQQEQFRQSVVSLRKQLASYRSIYLFCHYGIGRSPAVALAALRSVWGMPLQQAISTVRSLRPQAHISALSVSASNWVQARTR